MQANVVRIALKIDKLKLIRRNNLSINRILEIAGSQNPHISLAVQNVFNDLIAIKTVKLSRSKKGFRIVTVRGNLAHRGQIHPESSRATCRSTFVLEVRNAIDIRPVGLNNEQRAFRPIRIFRER